MNDPFDFYLWLRQALLFGHALAFAVALSTILRTDLALLRAGRIDVARIDVAAGVLTPALAALWFTGLALVACDAAQHGGAFSVSAKLLAKLIVVSALSLNGLVLHAWVLPALRDAAWATPTKSVAPLVLGAFSTTSWLYASFIGVSRLVAPTLGLGDYLGLYAAALAAAFVVVLRYVRPRLADAAALR